MNAFSRNPWLALEVLLGVGVLLPLVAPVVDLDVGPAVTSAFLFGPVLGVLVAVDGLVRFLAWLGDDPDRRPLTVRRLVGVGARVVEFTVAATYLLALLGLYLVVSGAEPGQGTGAGLSLFIVGLVGGVALALLVLARAAIRWFLADRADESPSRL